MVIISEETMQDMVTDEPTNDTNDGIRASCRQCKTVVTLDSFKDRLSLRMYNVGGICQACQDLIFDEDDDII